MLYICKKSADFPSQHIEKQVIFEKHVVKCHMLLISKTDICLQSRVCIVKEKTPALL